MFGITKQDVARVEKLHRAGLSVEDMKRARLNGVDIDGMSPAELRQAVTDSDTHRPTPGKLILVICCTTACMVREARRLLADGWAHYEHTPTRFYVQRAGELTFLTIPANVDRVIRARLFDEIRVCGNAEPAPRQAEMLRSHLKNPAAWPGHFPKIP